MLAADPFGRYFSKHLYFSEDRMNRTLFVASLASLFLSQPALAEEINEGFKKVNEYVQQKNYPMAMEDVG